MTNGGKEMADSGSNVEFIRPFRFAARLDGRDIGIAFVGPIESLFTGSNVRHLPVEIAAAPKVGGWGLAALLRGGRRHLFEIIETAWDGSVARVIRLRGCRLRHYSCEKHDAMEADAVIIERVRLHPTRVDIRPGRPAADPLDEVTRTMQLPGPAEPVRRPGRPAADPLDEVTGTMQLPGPAEPVRLPPLDTFPEAEG